MSKIKNAVQLELPNIEQKEQPQKINVKAVANDSTQEVAYTACELNDRQLELPNIDPIDGVSNNSAGVAGVADKGDTLLKWELPRPLIEDDLPPALKLRDEMLPRSIRAFVREKAYSIDNMSPDYLAVSLITMIAAVIGSNIEIEPKRHDKWRVVCILWSLLVGKASEKKTPAMSATMSFVNKVKKKVIAPITKRNASINALKKKRLNVKRQELEQELEDAFDIEDEALQIAIADKIAQLEEPPILDQKEVYVNDSTIEALTICAQTSLSGLAIVRDELSGLLSVFNQQSRSHERAVFLEGYSGQRNSYVIRRVSREDVVLPQLFIGLLGGIQPDMLKPLIKSATEGKQNDGFLERCLQMSVLPTRTESKPTDHRVSDKATASVHHVFAKLAELDTPLDPVVLKFSPRAQEKWTKWSEEALLDVSNSSLVMESYHVKRLEHCAKLAMIFHLIEEASNTPKDQPFKMSKTVEVKSMTQAMVWMRYLRSHAYRIVASAQDKAGDESPAKVLLSRLSSLNGQFTKHALSQKGWKSLKTAVQRDEAINTLLQHGYLKESMIITTKTSKPTKGFLIHPDYR
ncbi:DUF3987 domain-containing protein [Vibrio splendidus]|uniref:DUF3987 domain-containing protein n=1 Tax=Vibrio splendidus TaxID=29497 RepID=UPI000C83FF95|nr:DUF3987 domain-containing protein [Vibrio splendidus]PMP02404.1 hypothetical protein BCS97_23490 [Vibrio splendidus]PMP22849.1 hypothetical protein BCS89_16835 [Vibrio splendidus]PMP26120.1 hypothetical protein BCS88_22985 [Vibrio splendidus]PMP46942.1 hypothetical protein BCS87_22665 [Vibrio splendidus]PMP51353.1 hypothetical protein BCS83_19810 [Vibrio splendidus]